MDEPHISNTMNSDISESDKTNIDEVLDSAFSSGDLEKSMEVDDAFASTSAIDPIMEVTNLESKEIEESAVESTEQEESNVLETSELDRPDESIEQIDFDKTSEDHNETVQTEVDMLDFTEKSINISQINVEHNDDSNDAFNALKESETDALNEEVKDEIEEDKEKQDDPAEEIESKPQSPDEVESKPQSPAEEIESKPQSPAESESKPQSPENEQTERNSNDEEAVLETASEERQETLETSESAPMETDDTVEKIADDNQTDDNDVGIQTIDDAETITRSEFEDRNDEFDNMMNETVEDRQEEVEEEDTTETTNEGEGIDENVCLLGDAERELTDADKERVVQPQEISEEDDDAAESTTGDKETSTISKEGGDEAMDVDDSEQADAEKEPDQIEGEGEEEVEAEAEPEVEEVVDHSVPLKENEIREIINELNEETCLNCENVTNCQYRLLEDSGEIKFLCTYNCVKEHREDNPDKYSLTQKKVLIYEIPLAEHLCSKCNETKSCKYHYRITVTTTVSKEPVEPSEPVEGESEVPQPLIETVQSTENKYICDDNCLQDYIGGNTEKFIVKEVKRRSTRARQAPKSFQATEEQEVPKIAARSDADVEAAKLDRDESFIRRCTQCFHIINFTSKSVQWETLDFCNEKCLGLYQNLIGATCVKCNDIVTLASIGKLCVRFGFDLKQFCSTKCLDDFKKVLKQCALCQQDLSENENIVLAQVGEKRIYRDFCNQECLKQYENIMNPRKKLPSHLCSVCNNKKQAKIEVFIDENIHRLCSNPCFSAFKFVNNVVPDQCDMCTRYFERKSSDAHTIYQGSDPKIFCSRVCMNLHICRSRDIWQCNWCKVSKYNYDMIQLNFAKIRMCSLNCLSLHEVSLNALTPKRSKCAHCKILKQPQYHLSMSDASIRHFCTYQCAIGFQSTFSKSKLTGEGPSVVPAGTAKRIKPSSVAIEQAKQASVPVIARVQSLSTRRVRGPYNPIANRSKSPIPVPELTVQLERLSDLPSRVKVSSLGGSSSWTAIPTTSSRSMTPPARVEHKTQVVTIPPLPIQVTNKSTMCKAITLNKAVHAVPTCVDAECQTEDFLERKIILPVPIPIFIPQPMYMYNMPTPIPVPIPLPIPVPIFIPTTRNSAQGIMKEIKKIQDKMPTDPYEAELLMMAEMVAGDRKREETDSDSDENNDMEYGDGIENNSSFNEDLVQMAFKMASGNDFDDPPVDLENEMTANTISQNAHGYDDMDPQALHHHQLLLLHQQREAAMQSNRGRKRMQPVKQNNSRNSTPNKRIKREMEVMQPEMPREPAEKPDANMCLKYTFGVNAWKQWVATKNADFEKSSIRRKPIKSEILQLTADELNYSLCMFVKEVRKPNGSEYAPDTIYYLVLGIQQYLYENGRIDNIFTDRYYEQFTDCLDEVAKKFSVLYNDSQYIVTRVEEEHLWECKQLGAHSPHVLLSTLMFFNTKHFNLVTVDEHMELSFSHIMKHWKRNPNQPGAAKMPGSRNVLLRFYPPQSSLEANSRKKKVYEQQENEENPLRCPVKLYEFYLSKCPESVKTRNDVFYLQPERSCVPDSPVWYSTQALSRDALSKMLHRVKMVKEINIALLTS